MADATPTKDDDQTDDAHKTQSGRLAQLRGRRSSVMRRTLNAKAYERLSETVVVNELTLVAVILGVVLTSLIIEAQAAIRVGNLDVYPYILCSLAEVTYTYAVITNHTLSFVGW